MIISESTHLNTFKSHPEDLRSESHLINSEVFQDLILFECLMNCCMQKNASFIGLCNSESIPQEQAQNCLKQSWIALEFHFYKRLRSSSLLAFLYFVCILMHHVRDILVQHALCGGTYEYQWSATNLNLINIKEGTWFILFFVFTVWHLHPLIWDNKCH